MMHGVKGVRAARVGAVVLMLAASACSGGSQSRPSETQTRDAAQGEASLSDAPVHDSGSLVDSGATGGGLVPRDSAHVFFSGHSLINVNTPTFFAQVATAAGRSVEYQLQMGLGSTMSIRLACPRNGQRSDGGTVDYLVLEELRRGVYDTLIVTERNDIINAIRHELTTSMARQFRDALNVRSGARAFLFESWTNVDMTDPGAFRDRARRELIAWECVASRVNQSRGDAAPMLVVPAGQALAELVVEVAAGRVPGLTSLTQIFTDDVHLTSIGNYFISMIHYGVVLGRTPVGLVHTGLQAIAGESPVLTADSARYLQELAARYVERTFADAAASQRTTEECQAALPGLCEATLGVGNWGCTGIVAAWNNDSAPIPVITDDWCHR